KPCGTCRFGTSGCNFPGPQTAGFSRCLGTGSPTPPGQRAARKTAGSPAAAARQRDSPSTSVSYASLRQCHFHGGNGAAYQFFQGFCRPLKVPGFVQVVDVQIQIGVDLGAVDAV